MKENKLLSVNQIFHVEVAKLMHNVTLESIPKPFLNIFSRQTRLSTTSTRSGTTFLQGPATTAKCDQSISFIGPKIWNSTPREVRFISSENEFIVNNTPLPFKTFLAKMKTFALENIDFI